MLTSNTSRSILTKAESLSPTRQHGSVTSTPDLLNPIPIPYEIDQKLLQTITAAFTSAMSFIQPPPIPKKIHDIFDPKDIKDDHKLKDTRIVHAWRTLEPKKNDANNDITIYELIDYQMPIDMAQALVDCELFVKKLTDQFGLHVTSEKLVQILWTHHLHSQYREVLRHVRQVGNVDVKLLRYDLVMEWESNVRSRLPTRPTLTIPKILRLRLPILFVLLLPAQPLLSFLHPPPVPHIITMISPDAGNVTRVLLAPKLDFPISGTVKVQPFTFLRLGPSSPTIGNLLHLVLREVDTIKIVFLEVEANSSFSIKYFGSELRMQSLFPPLQDGGIK
ncbi:hypothetical protein BC833DRAFT_636843 [Globomyces pollinis-pini]|nr:hypothetical protein BC833DRAFT_636843 [Globomyces pollinis-pini]